LNPHTYNHYFLLALEHSHIINVSYHNQQLGGIEQEMCIQSPLTTNTTQKHDTI